MKKYKISLGLLVLLIIWVQPSIAAGKTEVVFKYEPAQPVESVHVVGSFNSWSTSANPLTDEDGDGVYQAKVKLSPGNYGYRYLIDGHIWKKPPDADAYGQYGYGKDTGIIYIESEIISGEDTQQGDGEISVISLCHNKYNLSYANPLSKEKVSIKFRTRKDDVEEVILHYDDGKDKSVKMKKVSTDEEFDFYQANIEVAQKNFGYQFEIKDGTKRIWYAANGAVTWPGTRLDDLEPVNYLIEEEKIFSTPDWVKDAVFYRIFVDRFYNGNTNNDPEKIEVYRSEDELFRAVIPDWEQGVPANSNHVILDKDEFLDDNNTINPAYGYHVFYGGDLQGIEEKISYLKRLGINAICLNPIFEAVSNDKYNTSDYKLVEDNFAVKGDHKASEEYLKKLIKKLHDNDIKVILDISFNYTGYEHWAFQDVVEKGRRSEYTDWYFFKDYPVKKLYDQWKGEIPNYKAWWGFGAYPVLNIKEQRVKEYLFEVTRKWMDPDGDGDPDDGIDGWRLSFAAKVENLDPGFWEEWRKVVKEVNPQAYICGEVWDYAGQFLQGDEFDAVTNYNFRELLVDFIVKKKITADEFGARLARIDFNYPEQSDYGMMNLISNHDTKRFLTLANEDKDKLKLASFLQFTYLGVPVIYYGDEIGMKGGQDPDNKRTMIWSDRGYTKPDRKLFNHYQKLIKLRKEEAALRKGKIEEVPIENDLVYGFKRVYKGKELLVLINAGAEEAEISVPLDLAAGKYRELYKGLRLEVTDGKLEMNLDPVSGAIINLEPEKKGQAEVVVTAEPNARMVVRGTMNNWGDWETGEDIIMHQNKDGTWSTTLNGLTPGEVYTYKYVLEYKNTNVDIGIIGPEKGEKFTFIADSSTYTLTTPFTKQELNEEKDWFTIEQGSVKVGKKEAKLGEKFEVGVPAGITVNNKYHVAKKIRPTLNIGEVNKINVKLDQIAAPIKYTFTFDPDDFGDPEVVEGIWLKGNFDGWRNEYKLIKKGDVYQKTLKIYPGRYKYFFFDKAYYNEENDYIHYKNNGKDFNLRITRQ